MIARFLNLSSPGGIAILNQQSFTHGSIVFVRSKYINRVCSNTSISNIGSGPIKGDIREEGEETHRVEVGRNRRGPN